MSKGREPSSVDLPARLQRERQCMIGSCGLLSQSPVPNPDQLPIYVKLFTLEVVEYPILTSAVSKVWARQNVGLYDNLGF